MTTREHRDRLFPARTALALLVLISVACADAKQTAEPPLREVQRLRTGDLEVVVLAPTDVLRQTRNYCTVEFRTGADHHLVEVGTVKVRTTMTMEGAPMDGFVTDPKRIAKGRYTTEMVLAMNGQWQVTIDWDGPAGRGSVSFRADVRSGQRTTDTPGVIQ